MSASSHLSSPRRGRTVLAIVLLVIAQLAITGNVLPLYALPNWLRLLIALGFVFSIGLMVKAAKSGGGIRRAIAYSLAYLLMFDALVIAVSSTELASTRELVISYGWIGVYLLGLGWFVWWVEQANLHIRDSHAKLAQTSASQDDESAPEPLVRIWNPVDARAWYYGQQSNRLNQSILLLIAYSLFFVVVTLVSSSLGRGREIYEMPGGGGGGGGGGAAPQMQAFERKVRIKKVVKKKFVINPYSSIKFTEREIDNVPLDFEMATKHEYKAGTGKGGAGFGSGSGVGYGDGDGSGFGPGTSTGKVRFIRLEYTGGDWDQDFGVGSDVNLLIEYKNRTSQRTAEKTESRTIAQLASFPPRQSPPLVYMTGQRNISLSKSEVKTLREYLLDKHGMLFCDNGGSRHFHSQFFDMMRQVLPEIQPVKVPLDDIIHRMPYQIPFLPYVAPHGGKDAWGWKVDGRWVCYYHPGDIGDAWSDGHAGVNREVWEACYQLGVNVIFYSHMEYSKWLISQQTK